MEKTFKKIGIIYNCDVIESINLAKKIKEKLNNSILFCTDEMNNDIDLAIAIGGDGTFLKTARFYSPYSIPVLGFNVGRLGYLAQAKPEEIENVIQKLNNNDFKIENRLMLKANNKTALNDVVIKGVNCARSSTMNLYINDNKLCSYVADGLIISTPTGSTAYSLSAGGPIISPDVNAFCITPIAAHAFSQRAIVCNANSMCEICVAGGANANLFVDGRYISEVNKEMNISIEKADNFTSFLRKQDFDFYKRLSEKLKFDYGRN